MHDASCKGAINYLNLAREILQKNDLTKLPNAEKFLDETGMASVDPAEGSVGLN